jgi:GH15 family glucan-1,4-alpha-glucosidase
VSSDYQNGYAVSARYQFTLDPGTTKVIYSVRAFQEGLAIEDQIAHIRTKTPEQWIADTKAQYDAFLAKAAKPDAAGDRLELYKKSLLVLKNSQNPSNGLIFQSAYWGLGHNSVTRDGLIACLALDSAGYHDEAETYLRALERLGKTGADDEHSYYRGYLFRPIYNGWLPDTGDSLNREEYEYDTYHLFLIALNYHCYVTEDYAVVNEFPDLLKRIFYDFTATDYSGGHVTDSDSAPWNIHTQRRYSVYTQSIAYAGSKAFAQLAKHFNEQNKLVDEDYAARVERIEAGRTQVINEFWDTENNYLVRGSRDGYGWDNTLEPTPDAGAFAGILAGSVTGKLARLHYKKLRSELTRGENGIIRYNDDYYLYENPENHQPFPYSTVPSPVWVLSTCFAAWAEDVLGLDFGKRLDYIAAHSLYGNMPGGSAIDWEVGQSVVPTATQAGLFAAPYVYTLLLYERKALSILNSLN